MKTEKMDLKLSSFFKMSSSLGLGLLLGVIGTAQIGDPHTDCTNGCTANDVQIKSAYLVEPNAPYNPLTGSFQCQGSASVKLALDLTTKTPRVGVYVYAQIVNHVTPSTIYATVSECFSTALASGGVTKVVFSTPVSWPCGTAIDLSNVFIGWGTGGSDFCAGSPNPRCPATPSKCFSLPPGSYITIVVPTSANAAISQCETTAGGGTASFNLTSVNGTVSNNANNVTVNYWETNTSGVLSNCIPTAQLTAYISGSKTVYAKVKNNSDSTAFSVSNVALTVVSKPATLSLTGSSICASNPGTGTVSSTASQSGVSYQLQDAANTNVQSAKAGTGSGLSWTTLAAGSYHVVSTGGSPNNCAGGSNTANVTSIANPTDLVLTGSSICASNPGTGTVTSSTSQSTVSYQLKDGSNGNVQSPKSGTGSGLTWTGLAVGTNYHVVSTGGSPTNCGGASNNVDVVSAANPTDLSLTGSSICASAPNTGTVSSSTSQSGVSYQLQDGSNSNVQSAKPGTGSGLTWTALAAGTGYHVVATGAGTTACAGGSNNVNVTSVSNPVDLVLTGSSICAGTPGTGSVSSSTSQSGVTYQLKDGANGNVQAAKAGTGSGLSWTSLAAGTNYHVVSTGGSPTNCSAGSNNVDVISVANPADLVLTGSSICSSNPGTGTVSSSASQTGVSYQLKDGANSNVQSAKTGTGSGLSWTGLAAGTGYHVVSTGVGATACPGASNSVNVGTTTNPSAPSLNYNAPACDQTTFSITITGVINGASYSVNDKNGATIAGLSPASPAVAANTNNITFSGIPAGSGYQVTVTNNGCTSIANSCGSAGVAAHNNIQGESLRQTEAQTTVKAYPNPFSDKINFVVSTPVSGKGSLEVYNMMGQRVKTVYQGFISAGSQTYQMSSPRQQVANLIYVLRIGDKKISGKILQINQ